MTPDKPYTRAMPSPDERTVPVSFTSICLPYILICSRRMRLISSALISISLCSVLLGGAVLQIAAQALELCLDAPVEDLGAYLCDQAADDLRIGTRVQHDRATRGGGEHVADAPQLVFGERPRTRHRRAEAANLFVDHLSIGARDRG